MLACFTCVQDTKIANRKRSSSRCSTRRPRLIHREKALWLGGQPAQAADLDNSRCKAKRRRSPFSLPGGSKPGCSKHSRPFKIRSSAPPFYAAGTEHFDGMPRMGHTRCAARGLRSIPHFRKTLRFGSAAAGHWRVNAATRPCSNPKSANWSGRAPLNHRRCAGLPQRSEDLGHSAATRGPGQSGFTAIPKRWSGMMVVKPLQESIRR